MLDQDRKEGSGRIGFIAVITSRHFMSRVVITALPLIFLEAVRWLSGSAFSWSGLILRSGFVVSVLILARLSHLKVAKRIHLPAFLVLFIPNLIVTPIYIITRATIAGWSLLAFVYALFINLDSAHAIGQNFLARWFIRSLLAITAGILPIAVTQIESHFSEEEFFSALQAVVLSIFWLLLVASDRVLGEKSRTKPTIKKFARRVSAILITIAVVALLIVTVKSYQNSFYPPSAPMFESISHKSPFLCSQASTNNETYSGRDVFKRLLALVEANPNKKSPEYGMLAIGSGEKYWAELFLESLLEEARQGLFTGPSNSVKSTQFDAALRIYYYARVTSYFPDLFNTAQKEELSRWFSDINRRAQTVEWVDLMYALAFAKWPEGPYENQEIGAGLLALLETENISDPGLKAKNQDYLARNQRSWIERFRNSDDAIIYQPEWIYNAYFQSLYSSVIPLDNLQSSFEWLMLQALPDGAPLRYNHPAPASMAGIAYLGASLLGDDRYIWLSGKALDYLESQKKYLSAVPRVEAAVDILGHAPEQETCLLFGDSGLPNQIGPLAPDKIVFRDGWSEDSTYLLLNLRFTGWHRYKATNTVTLFYKSGPLVVEKMSDEPFRWLPVGRSLFRDKRIPRENLNGLIVEKRGMSAALNVLTGIGSPWAQDPPYYARVERFETGSRVDASTTLIEWWHGWRHKRSIYFHHNGPIIIVDDARGPKGQNAALVWHIVGNGNKQGERVILREGDQPAAIVLLPIGGGEIEVNKYPGQASGAETELMLRSFEPGHISFVTIFLTADWFEASANIIQTHKGSVLQIVRDTEVIIHPLDPRD